MPASPLALLLAAWIAPPVHPSPDAPHDPAAPAAAEREPVHLTLVGAPERRGPIREVLGELLDALPVAPRWDEEEVPELLDAVSPASIDPSVLASIYVDLSRDDLALIFVADRGFERVLVRRVPLPGGVDEVSREQVGAIVSGAVQALLDGARIGMTRQEAMRQVAASNPLPPAPAPSAPPAAPAPSAPPATPASSTPPAAPTEAPPPSRTADAPSAPRGRARPGAWPWLAAEAGYGVSFWRSTEAVGHGMRLRLELAAGRPRWILGVALSGAALLPQTVGLSVLPTRLSGASLRAAALARGWVHRRVALRGQLGVGVDLLRAAPKGGTPRWTPLPMAGAALGADVFITPRLWVGLAATTEVDLVDTRILDLEGVVVLDPWRARPGLRLGLGWQFAGARGFSGGR